MVGDAVLGVVSRAWRRWWGGRSLRTRLTLFTALALTLVLGLGSQLFVVISRQAMIDGVARPAQQQATALATRLRLTSTAEPLTSRPGQLVQVADSAGNLINTVPRSSRLGPMLTAGQVRIVRRGEAVYTRMPVGGVMGRDGGSSTPQDVPVVVVGAPSTLAGEPVTVLVIAPIDDVLRSAVVMRVAVSVGVPLIIAIVTFAVWFAIGSALRPVAALRRGAAEIAYRTPRQRLPVPEAKDEIHDLASTLNDMLDRLAAASARQRSFTADAAHELRSPLASVRAQLEVALTHPKGTDWPGTGRGVLTDVERLTRLSEDLLALARLDGDESDDREPNPATDPGAVAFAVAERYGSARVPVDAEIGGGDVRAAAAAHDLERVLVNLVDNAVRHATSQVTVRISADSADVVLAVTDDGPGIPQADRQRVFERFTRLDDARARDVGGAGLGLAIVAETVHRYRGSVALGEADPGLVATVRLPRVSG